MSRRKEKGEKTVEDQNEEGQIWELPSPPNEDEESYEKSEEEEDYDGNDDTHIKVRMKQRVQKGKAVYYFSGLLMVYKIMKDFEDRLELLPFDSNDISVGIKSYKELQIKRKVWEKYSRGC